MDKRIALKKPRHKRIIKNEIPDLNSGEHLLYLQHYQKHQADTILIKTKNLLSLEEI